MELSDQSAGAEPTAARAWLTKTAIGKTSPLSIGRGDTQQVFPLAEFAVMKDGMAPEAAIDKAFKRLEAIYAKYPIAQT